MYRTQGIRIPFSQLLYHLNLTAFVQGRDHSYPLYGWGNRVQEGGVLVKQDMLDCTAVTNSSEISQQ
jgi:hypothetical protein